jgi:hypothetical protein
MSNTKEIAPIEVILTDHVAILPGHIGLKIDDKISLDESLAVLDWTAQMQDHVGFLVGDVINHGEQKWGTKYAEAILRTGRAYSTLKQYASVAARIPVEERKAELSFSHHELIVRTSEPLKLLEETAKQAEEGEAPTIKELRAKVRELKPPKPPRKKRKPKEPTQPKLSQLQREEIIDILTDFKALWTRIKVVKRELFSLLPNKKKYAAELRPLADWLADFTQ